MRDVILAVALCLPIGAVLTRVSSAAQAESSGWITGTELDKQLAAPISVTWSKTPLSRVLKSLADARHLAIVLDRRVDSDQEVQLSLTQEPLEKGLRKLAEQLQLGYCQFGPVAYFGPPSTAKRLRTLAALRLEGVRSLPAAETRKFLQFRSSHWDELREPRQILAELAEEAQVKVVGSERIPHDLWPAADLPPLTWIDRLTLLTAQFDLAFSISKDGREIQLTPMPPKTVLVRTYQEPRQTEAVAKRWAKSLPLAHVSAEGNKIRVEASLEDHELIERRRHGPPPARTTVTAGKEVYQLALEEAALSQVIDQLAQRLSLEFQWDRPAIERASISTDQLISVKIQNASLDELLRAVLANTGLTFRRTDHVVTIYPALAGQAKP